MAPPDIISQLASNSQLSADCDQFGAAETFVLQKDRTDYEYLISTVKKIQRRFQKPGFCLSLF